MKPAGPPHKERLRTHARRPCPASLSPRHGPQVNTQAELVVSVPAFPTVAYGNILYVNATTRNCLGSCVVTFVISAPSTGLGPWNKTGSVAQFTTGDSSAEIAIGGRRRLMLTVVANVVDDARGASDRSTVLVSAALGGRLTGESPWQDACCKASQQARRQARPCAPPPIGEGAAHMVGPARSPQQPCPPAHPPHATMCVGTPHAGAGAQRVLWGAASPLAWRAALT